MDQSIYIFIGILSGTFGLSQIYVSLFGERQTMRGNDFSGNGHLGILFGIYKNAVEAPHLGRRAPPKPRCEGDPHHRAAKPQCGEDPGMLSPVENGETAELQRATGFGVECGQPRGSLSGKWNLICLRLQAPGVSEVWQATLRASGRLRGSSGWPRKPVPWGPRAALEFLFR